MEWDWGMQMRTECDVLTRQTRTPTANKAKHTRNEATWAPWSRETGSGTGADGTPTSPHHTPPPRLGARDRDAPAAAPHTAGRAPPRPSALLAPRAAPRLRRPAPGPLPRPATAPRGGSLEAPPCASAAGGGRRRGASVGPSGGGASGKWPLRYVAGFALHTGTATYRAQTRYIGGATFLTGSVACH